MGDDLLKNSGDELFDLLLDLLLILPLDFPLFIATLDALLLPLMPVPVTNSFSFGAFIGEALIGEALFGEALFVRISSGFLFFRVIFSGAVIGWISVGET